MDTKLNIGDIPIVCERLHNARTKWEEIGLKLSVPPETLESINLRHKDYHDKCLREMLTWYLEHDGPLTWRDLCDCLRSPSVGRNDVAKVIERWMSVFTSDDEEPPIEIVQRPILTEDFELMIGHLGDVCNQLHPARDKWEEIGLGLGVKNGTLDSIRKAKNQDCADCLKEMVKHRLCAHEEPLTWRKLCDCLRTPTVGREDLANEVEGHVKSLAYIGTSLI